jgi:tetratricopeptide (TPR) repeat protein
MLSQKRIEKICQYLSPAMTWNFSLPRRALITAFTVAAICSPATAFAGLSDNLSQKIAEARAAEHNLNYDAAFAVYEQAMKMDHATPEAMRVLLKNRSQLFETIRLYDNAEQDLTEIFKVTPNDASAYADRGYFYMRRGRYGAALDDFVTGSRLDPQNPLYLFAAARSLVAVEDFVSAVAFYTEAIKAGPNEAKHYLARAEALLRLKRFPEALADYDRAESRGLTKLPEKYFLHAGRGFAALSTANYAAALTYLDRALVIDPDAVNVMIWRGYAHERRGNYDLALHDYEHAERLRPADATARDGARRVRSAQH